jgi:histidine triad (HIT) family protein
MDCVFCKIVKGEIPSHKIYEDEEFLAFLDIQPVNPGHVLLIPKSHSENLVDAPEEVLQKILPLSRKLAGATVAALGAEGFNLTVNNGQVAGQVVFHLHVHIIPRMPGDGHGLWSGRKYQEGEAEKTAAAIRNKMS